MGQMGSQLLRTALNGWADQGHPAGESTPAVAGFRPFAAQNGRVVSHEQIDQLRDEAGP